MRNLLRLFVVLLLSGGPAYAQSTGSYLPANNLTSAGTGCVTSGGSILKGNLSGGCGNAIAGTDYLGTGSVGGDCTFTSPSQFTCTKTNGVPFAAVATSSSAADLTTGVLNNARLPPNISVGTLTASSLLPNQCVQAGANGLLQSAGQACGGGTGGGGVGPGNGPQIAQYPVGSSSTVGAVTVGGDARMAQGGNMTVLSTQGTAFAASATQDTTNASNISTGTLPVGRMPLGLTVPPTAGQIPVGNTAGTAFVNQNVLGDCSLAATGIITCLKTNSILFAPSATTDTTNANNISSGTLSALRGGAGLVNGILRGNGSGTVTAAVSGTDYQPPIVGTTLASHFFANQITTAGVLVGAQPAAGDITGLAASATTDTTNATNISSGTLNNARLPSAITVTSVSAGAMTDSALASGQCVQTTTGGLLAVTGSPCGGTGGGSGVVASGTTGQIAQYPSAGTTVNGVTVSGDATIATGGAVSVAGLHFGATGIPTSSTAPTANQCLAINSGGTSIIGATCGSGGGSGTVSGTGAAPQMAQYTAATTVSPVTISGDATIATGGALTVTKTNGTNFATSATTDTTNATNISSGTLSTNRLQSPMHSLSGATPLAVVNSGTVASTDIEDLPLSVNVTTFNLPPAAGLANGSEMIIKIRQPSSGGPFTLPTGTAGTALTAGSGSTIINSVSTIGGCPTIPAAANGELYYDLLYNSLLAPTPAWVVVGCFTNPAQNFPNDVGFMLSGTPSSGQVFPTIFTRQVNFATNFAGSFATCGTNPAETDAYSVKVAGVQIGTVTLSTGCVPAFTTTGSTTVTANTRLELDAPSTVSGKDIAITLAGTR